MCKGGRTASNRIVVPDAAVAPDAPDEEAPDVPDKPDAPDVGEGADVADVADKADKADGAECADVANAIVGVDAVLGVVDFVVIDFAICAAVLVVGKNRISVDFFSATSSTTVTHFNPFKLLGRANDSRLANSFLN